jgi:predicted thioesterase
MIEDIRAGLSGEKSIHVTRELTIASLDNELPAVYGTPSMIMLMEVTAAEVLEPYLPPGHISVGVEVSVRHLAATPLGEKVTCTARVLETARNLIRFEVEARDEHQLIGVGAHTRAIIEFERFMRSLAQRQVRP